ncbi:S-layer homology domain-containing protein [Paenibacillus thiaminolyticus]|uniref:S-layer homology domain-containing protein n=3 Tax=Paenibacillus thiaminolyticus TaxID=49283 RepID=A0AAP9DRA6_PANTH|nr:S-layer homology domain-containing protein [Paenibacillus thiaminolyticus]MCY9605161.1 S-layer homology domain-containing protein [Paenibacillus thiaminolyticus]MCY9607152.1 S-layer homology domain-containing protein [Paenibacillus thiaminolyticus]MCY9616277.1 S-layer homology domain-containing protein [Paenibacillus thiaminolyticus]MCY9620070.1 S-layer homology domain-containing protein [Paenibacillus thiaminolyticus]MCY9627165.1 S-layer homology domain-containing protein [Paenibacillus th
MIKGMLRNITIMAVLLTIFPLSVFASEPITLEQIANKKPGEAVELKGKSTLKEVSVKVLRPNKTILYVDVADTGAEGAFAVTFHLPSDADLGEYTAIAGQGSESASGTFNVTAKEDNGGTPGGTPGSGSSGGSGGGGGGGGGSTSTPSSTTPSNGRTINASSASFTLNSVKFDIPAGAAAKTLQLKVEKVSSTSGLNIPAHLQLASEVFEITVSPKEKLVKNMTIALPFDSSKFHPDKYELAVYRLDADKKEWIALENISLNASAKTVSGEVDQFAKLAVLAKAKEEAKAEEPQSPQILLKDINGHWAEKNILALVQRGAIAGYQDNTFKPKNKITRAEFATILVKALDLKGSDGKGFKDTEKHWAKDNIAIASAHGIVNGYDSTTFGPNDPITREQMAAMVVKAFDLKHDQPNAKFKDQDKVSKWAVKSVETAIAQGILSGYNNNINPQENANRAEAVTVVANALGL